MAITKSIAKLISAKVLAELKKNLVASKICTEDTGSQIKKMGDTVTFVSLTDPTVKTYEGAIVYDELSDDDITLVIDQKDYVAFTINDIEAFQSSIDLKGATTERSMYRLKDKADSFIFKLHTGITTNVIDASTAGKEITSANVLNYLAQVKQKLSEQNVPDGQMWIVVDPAMKTKMILAGIKFQINNGMSDGKKGGMAYTNYLEMDCYVSNNIQVVDGVHKIMAGAYNAIIYSEQILKSRFIAEMETKFAGGYSALHVYGGRILREKELCLLNAKFAEETTI